MTAEELKSKITFDSRDIGDNLTMLTGAFEVYYVEVYDRRRIELLKDGGHAIAEIQSLIRERILRIVYDDRRAELYDAILELFKVNPMDYAAMASAREKIMLAAKHQPKQHATVQ